MTRHVINDVSHFFGNMCNVHYTHAWDSEIFTKGLDSMERFQNDDKQKYIVATTWEYLLKTGLGNASVGELCKLTKLAQSSLYYWFDNKDDIWISAGRYGISKVVDSLLIFTFDHFENVEVYFEKLLDEVEKYKYELRLAIQITTSPVYGDRMREKANDFRLWYDKYAEKIIAKFGCTLLQAETFIYSIIAFAVDYVIWDDREKTQMLLDNLYCRVSGVIEGKR